MSIKLPRRLPWLLLISALIILADRFTKRWVEARIPLGGAIPLIPRILRITHWTNQGAAFSLFADSTHPQLVHLGLVGFNILAALAVLIFLGGALGSVHDRLLYGSVVDFIEVHIFSYHWPDFNIADSAIVTGACLLLLDSLLPRREPSPPPKLSS